MSTVEIPYEVSSILMASLDSTGPGAGRPTDKGSTEGVSASDLMVVADEKYVDAGSRAGSNPEPFLKWLRGEHKLCAALRGLPTAPVDE